MSTHRKSWSAAEKLQIINHYKQHGATRTAREFGVSANSIYKWKALYDKEGQSGLEGKRSAKISEQEQENKRLLRENEQLKALVAEKELILRIQKEMLKKSR